MANTPNYGLLKPDRTDNINDVDTSLANNFTTIDLEIKNRKDEIDGHIAGTNGQHTSEVITHADGNVKTTLENHETRLGNAETELTDHEGRLTDIETLGLDLLGPDVENRIATLESDVEGFLAPATFDAMNQQSYTFDEYRIGYVQNALAPINEQLAEKAKQADLQGRAVNVLYPPTPYVAAKGDGTTDDLTAIQNLINAFDVIIVPKPSVNYRMGGNLTIGAFKNITSSARTPGGNATLQFDSGFGIISDGRYTTVENITLSTPTSGGSGIGILFSNSTGIDHHFLTFKNLIINNFGTGMKTASGNFMWNCTFKDIRFNYVTNALVLGVSTNTSFGLRFERVYMNVSTQIMSLTGVEATFDNCNFGLRSINAIVTDANTSVTFKGCNFECDTHITGTGYIFNLSSKAVRFEQCGFPMTVDATVNVIGLFSGMQLVSFNDCTYKSTTGNLLTNFWNKSASNTANLFAIKFIGNSNTIPRPDYFNAQMANFVDLESNVLPAYNTSVDKTKMKAGMVFWHTSLKKPVCYDGTNIIDFTGTIIAT